MKPQQKQPISLPKYGLLFMIMMGIIIFTNTRAQTPPKTEGDKVYTATEKTPEPVGGYTELYKFMAATIRYPKEMHDKNVQGMVMVQFIVETDGSLSNIKAIRGPGYGAEEESVRVMGLSPKWIPGEQGGKVVRVQFTLPVKFTLGGIPPATGQPDKKTGEIDIKKIIDTKPPFYYENENNLCLYL